MILLDWDGTATRPPGAVLLFGTGLIGGAILNAFKLSVDAVNHRRFNWSWSEQNDAQAAVIEKRVKQILADRDGARLTVIWAAGSSGFASLIENMEEETDAFREVIAFARRLGKAVPPERRGFVHVSSAGGLFEGQVACDAETRPAPLRPYGDGKVAQERLLLGDDTLGQRQIVRPSSVYGYAPGARRGLIPALVAAGLQGRAATITGALTTQRDYVFAPDVGRFVVARVLGAAGGPRGVSVDTALLASARPTSVFEILHLVEGYLGTPLHLQVDPRPENARDNTFLPSAIPKDFRPTGLSEGIALTASAVKLYQHMGAAV